MYPGERMNEKVDCKLKSVFLTALSLLPDSTNPFAQSQLNKNYTSFIVGGMINNQPTKQPNKQKPQPLCKGTLGIKKARMIIIKRWMKNFRKIML